jgi:hypothetical protein
VLTCAGPIEGNCDAIQGIFKGFSDYLKLKAKGNFILPFCTIPDVIGDKGVELSGNLAKAISG